MYRIPTRVPDTFRLKIRKYKLVFFPLAVILSAIGRVFFLTDYSTYSDHELFLLLSRDDHESFEAIYTRYWEQLFTSAYIILRDHNSSKDVVQDIFIWLWEKRANVKIGSIAAYLKAAVRFKIANLIRGDRIRESFYTEVIEFKSNLAPTPSQLAEVKEMQEIIQQAVNQLPRQCRTIYQLRRERQLSNQEIAEHLGLSLKTVENQITIAQKRIRESFTSSFLLVSFVFDNINL